MSVNGAPIDPVSAVLSAWRWVLRDGYGQGRTLPSTPIRTDPVPGWDPTAAGPSLRELLNARFAPAPPFQGPLPPLPEPTIPAPSPAPPAPPPPTAPPPTTAPPAPQRPEIPIPSGDPDRGTEWGRILAWLLKRGPAIRWGVGAIFQPGELSDDIDILRRRDRAERERARADARVQPRVIVRPGELPEVVVQPAKRPRSRPKIDAPVLELPDVRVDPIRVPVPEVPALPSPAPAPPAPATRPVTPTLPDFLPFLPFRPGLRSRPPGTRAPPSTRTPPSIDPLAPFTPEPPGLTPRDVPDVSLSPFAPPSVPPTSSRDCQCTERKPRRKKSCTNPVVWRRKREKDGRTFITTKREVKCQSSSGNSRSRRARPSIT